MKKLVQILSTTLVLMLFFSACKKTETEDLLKENSIVISTVEGTKTGTCGAGKNEYAITINYSNPKAEDIINIEVDYIYPNGDGYFSYTYTGLTVTPSVINWTLCRAFSGSPMLVRVFVVTTGGKRSAPKTFSLITQ